MTRLLFWDVDTLYDFMHAEGRLYVPGSQAIIPTLAALTAFAHARRIPIVASADDHRPTDAEISEAPDWVTTFPPHCMHGTPGQQKITETALTDPMIIEPELQDPGALAHRILGHRGDFLLTKRTLDVFSNANTTTLLRALEPEAIVIYGVATDFCDKYTVEGLLLHRPEADLFLVTDAIRPIYPEQGDRLLESWRDRGVHLTVAGDVLAGRGLESYLGATV
jgi:nicotinamidase/pyrazinamidase